MIVGTAGHIDHGKTTLVKALTGVDTDRLPEEKARGITLDLGYAYADEGMLGYVDVPGHEKLVHNMLAGATGIDFLLLAVAADDGPMPQTREHLAIASLLGIDRAAVALTKTDAASSSRLESARDEVAELLAGSCLEAAPVFAVSATDGSGIDELRRHLQATAALLGRRQVRGGFRLAIDRIFTLQGIGLVVTGTAFSGCVAVGDSLAVTPPGLMARVRSLHVQGQPAEEGRAGQRIAINLAGNIEKADLSRGMWLVAPRLHLPVQRFQCELQALESIHHWQPVHVHIGAADVTGRLALLEGETLLPGASQLAEILLDQPIGTLIHDRFILRDQSAIRTLGGGRVLDIFPPTRHKRAAARLALLRLCALDDSALALQEALDQQPTGVDLDRYALCRNLVDNDAQWSDLDLRVVGESGKRIGFSRANWSRLAERALAALAAEHQRAPEMIGVEHDRLRRLTLPGLPRNAFDCLVADLSGSGKLHQTGGWLHLPEHHATLSSADAELWKQLKPQFAAQPFQPPRVRDVADASGIAEEAVRKLLQRVARVGQIYPVAKDHFFLAEAVASLAGHVDVLCDREGATRAAQLRDIIGGGRKVS
ncbi:MAG: selenocysteine-specific translation elongation factor, partial [Proteobacteria bacterium]|nr:selenocysteine-specific translation elongation factor [Pseudomonadota bacterium]